MITVLLRGVRKMYQCTTNLEVLHQEYHFYRLDSVFMIKIGFLSDMSRSLQYYVGQIYYGNTELVNRLCFRGDH